MSPGINISKNVDECCGQTICVGWIRRLTRSERGLNIRKDGGVRSRNFEEHLLKNIPGYSQKLFCIC